MSTGGPYRAAPGGAAYRGSVVFRTAERAGSRLTRLLVTLFHYLDRVLWASVTGRVLSKVWQLGKEWGQGSYLVRKLWLPLGMPLFGLTYAPFGVKFGPETVTGIALALACVLPTEIAFVAVLGALVVTLWSKAKARTDPGRGTAPSCGESRMRFWVFPEFGTLLAMAVVFVFLLGSTLNSVIPGTSVYNFAIWCFYGLAFFLAVDAAARGKAEMVIWPFLTGSAFAGLMAVYQKFSGWLPPRSWLDERFEEDLVRYVGTFTNPTFLAEMLGLALPLTCALLLRRRDWRDRIVLLGFAGIQGIGMILTLSRGAWLGLIVSFAALGVLFERKLLVLGLVIGVIGLSLAPQVLVDRLLSSFSVEDSSNSYRIFIWRGAFEMLRHYLFRGVGLGAEAFGYVYPEYMIVQTPAPHAHSVYVEMLIEIGLLGFLALSWFFLVWVLDVLKVCFGEKGGWTERWLEIGAIAGVFAAVGGHLVQGVIEHTWYNPRVTLAFWGVMGLGAGIVVKKRKAETGGAS